MLHNVLCTSGSVTMPPGTLQTGLLLLLSTGSCHLQGLSSTGPVMCRVCHLQGLSAGVCWKDGECLTDLDFADDIALFGESCDDLQNLATEVEMEACSIEQVQKKDDDHWSVSE